MLTNERICILKKDQIQKSFMLRELVGLTQAGIKNHSSLVIYLEKEPDFKVKCEINMNENDHKMIDDLFRCTAKAYFARHNAVLPCFYVD